MDHVLGLDHVLAYLRDETLDDALARYRRAGFTIDAERVDAPLYGWRTGFVRFGHETLELCSVVDEAAFAAWSPRMPCDPAVRAAGRPFAVGFGHDDARAFGAGLIGRGYRDTAIRFDPPDPPEGRAGTQLAILDEVLEGAAAFVVSYAVPKSRWIRSDDVHPEPANGIRRWTGAVMVCDAPVGRATVWRDVLNPGVPLQGEGPDVAVTLPDRGVLRWMTPAAWSDWSGRQASTPRHRYDETACLTFRAASLDRAAQNLSGAGWQVDLDPDRGRMFAAHGADGIVLLVEE